MAREVTCATCGAVGVAGTSFCTTCGAARARPTLAKADPVACATCGAPRALGKQFCARCGSAHASPAPPVGPPAADTVAAGPRIALPIQPPPVPGPAEVTRFGAPAPYAVVPPPVTPPRRRGRAVLAGVVVLFLLAAGAGTAFVLLRGSDEPTTAAADQQDETTDGARGADPAATSAVPDPSDTAASSPGASAEPVPEPVPARCWDGSRAPAPGACTAPTGVRGLRWVFEGFDFAGQGCSLEAVRLLTGRYQYNCRQSETDDLYFNFSEFDSHRRGFTYYSRDAAGIDPTERRGLLRWDYYTRDHKTALLYVGGRWAVTVYSPDPAVRDRAVRNLLRLMRPSEQLRGLPG